MEKLKLEELKRPSLEEYKKKPKSPFIVVLDNIRSLNNVGSAFRTCDAFAAEKIILCGITGKPPHRDIKKTAIGAEESVAWEYAENAGALAEQLRAEGFFIVAVEQTDKSVLLQDFSMPTDGRKTAFFFGNEVFGVSDEVLRHVDTAVEIPQFGTKHSLNISVSVGVILWQASVLSQAW